MNLLKYKEALDEIELDTVEMKKRIYGVINKKRINRYKKLVAVFVAAVVVIMSFSNLPFFKMVEPTFTMTVYAADNNVGRLNNKFLNIKAESKRYMGSIYQDEVGNINHAKLNTNISMRIEGKDIETITYQGSDQMVTIETGLHDVQSYFVENSMVSLEEYNRLVSLPNNNLIYDFCIDIGPEVAISKLIGTKYTVAYEEQQNLDYGLVINAFAESIDKWYFNDFIINIIIKMKDGTEYHKNILVRSGENAFYDIEMKIIE